MFIKTIPINSDMSQNNYSVKIYYTFKTEKLNVLNTIYMRK